MSQSTIIRTIASFGFVVMTTAALAHAQLQKATPAVGGVVATSPTEIRLKFSEGVEPRFSSIALTTQAGAAVTIGKPRTDPNDDSAFIASIPQALAPGVYNVAWRAVSVDTHRTQGAFSFTVAP